MHISSPDDFRDRARRRLPRFLFDYLDGGAGGERTLAWNRDALDAVALRQRVLRDVSEVSMRATLFGHDLAMPVMLGPVGMAGMYARRGEVQAARAAGDAGVPFCLSTVSVCGLDEVTRAAGVPPWLQLYVIRDRGFMRDFLDRAEAGGVEVLVFTVDMPVPGVRRRDPRSGLTGPGAGRRQWVQALGRPGWAWDVGVRGRPHALGNLPAGPSGGLKDYMAWLAANFDPSIQWRDLEWIRDRWKGALIIKGVMEPDDAEGARVLGANGVVVSNHGGRQLDGAPATIEVLPAIAQRVGGRMTVLADGGVRDGLDVFRMLASGADGVLLGRAWVYALAAGGERGVAALLDMIARELETTMALTGAATLDAVRNGVCIHPSIMSADPRERTP